MIQQFLSQVYISEENKNTNSKIYMYSDICTTLFTIAKIWKQSKCPAAYELIKINYTHTMEYHSPTEKSENLPFSWMDLENIMLSGINQKNRNTYCMLSFISGLQKTVKSLVIQWLALHTCTAGGLCLLPAWGTRILQVMWQGLNK